MFFVCGGGGGGGGGHVLEFAINSMPSDRVWKNYQN